MVIHYKIVELIRPCQSIVLLKRLIWRRAYGRCRRKFLVFRTFLFSFQNWRLNNQMLNCQMLVPWGRSGEPIIESFELAFYFSSHYAIVGNVASKWLPLFWKFTKIRSELSFCNTENTLTYLKFAEKLNTVVSFV